MAKATKSDKGSAARMRGPRDTDAARDSAGAIPADAAPDEEMAVDMENDDMETEVDEAVESPSASAVALSSDAAVARGAIRAPARTGPPDFLMANPLTRFIVESIQELLRVKWPSPQEAWNMTLVVVAMATFVAVMLGAADLGLAKALSFLVSLGSGH